MERGDILFSEAMLMEFSFWHICRRTFVQFQKIAKEPCLCFSISEELIKRADIILAPGWMDLMVKKGYTDDTISSSQLLEELLAYLRDIEGALSAIEGSLREMEGALTDEGALEPLMDLFSWKSYEFSCYCGGFETLIAAEDENTETALDSVLYMSRSHSCLAPATGRLYCCLLVVLLLP